MEKLFKNTSLVLILLILTSFTIPTTVYICLSPGAQKYHYVQNGRGLNNMKPEIKSFSKSSAEDDCQLELCGWED